LITLGIVAGYFLLLGLMVLVLNAPLSDVWKELGVPAMDPHFGDLRNVVAGIENHDAGRALGDPNPFDPWNRPYIYPSLWLHVQALAFNRDTVVGFGWIIILFFFGSTFALLGKLTAGEGIFTGLFLISPAIMTGVERCNIDLVLFPLILAALALRRWPAASAALLLLATALKLHPVGALLAFAAPPWRKTLPWLAGILGLLFLYLLANWNELAVISAHAQHYPVYTFGSAVCGLWLGQMNPANGPPDFASSFFWGSLVLLAVGIAAVRFSPAIFPEPRWEREIYSFRLGAGLYLALFALGANNDYGLLFFLFCLPLLFRLRLGAAPLRGWAIAALACSLVYVNWDLFSDEYMIRHMLLKQCLAWGLVASLVGLLNATRSWPVTVGASGPTIGEES
jgi:hypothetical protein